MQTLNPLVLVTNRFDPHLRFKLPQMKHARFVYVDDLFASDSQLDQAQGIIIRSSTHVDDRLLKVAKNLKFVITGTSGFDHLNLETLKERSVRCFHIPESQSVAAAELTLLMILATARKFSLSQEQLKKGDWQRSLLLGRQIAGQQLGLVGLGRVGQQVAVRAQALGMVVCAFDPYLESVVPGVTMLGFEELMRSSDVISLHVPKTKKTRHMIKKETLSWMDTDACLINMSRGDVVNEPDLIAHLQGHPDFRAGLDVFAKEPLDASSVLLKMSNVVATPHIGASTKEALRESSAKSVELAEALILGQNVSGELPPKESWFSD